MRRARQQNNGFTLLELVIVIILLSIIALASSPVIYSSINAYNRTNEAITTLDQLRYATERIAREIREVDYIVPSSGAEYYDFSTLGGSQVIFKRSQVQESDTASRTVTIQSSGTSVTLGYSGIGSQTLATGVNGLTLTYCQTDGITCTGITTSNVRFVDIQLTLRLNGNDYTQNTRVELKNRS